MKLAASLLAGAVLLAGAIDASAAKKDKGQDASAKPALVGAYGDWKVYHSASGKTKICYLLSEPKKREPEDAKREQAYAFISERPAEHVRNEISFVMGFDVATAADLKEKKKSKKPKKSEETADATAPIVAIGDAEFDLAPKGSDLWIKNPAEESKVIAEMRKGANLVIKAGAKRGGATTDTYSLTGFSQAVDKALKDCPES
jgi:invasion protein IalB